MVYELLSRGEIPSIHIGTARRIPLTALRAWVEAQIEQHLSSQLD
jgi:excisionase family DNA binding protein